MRRGFKTEAERLSLATRAEMGLAATDRLDPNVLAAHLAIPIVSLEVLRVACPDAVRQLVDQDPEAFSAATISRGTRRMILLNPVHTDGRQANSLAHELAHVLLEHEPGPVLGAGGCRIWDQDAEEEAYWLGGALLLPRDGVLALTSNGVPLEGIAAHFGVSVPLARWRYNQTGVAVQIARIRAKRSRVPGAR
jgi:Zn-dependent peptidase ImmA (M78 family)